MVFRDPSTRRAAGQLALPTMVCTSTASLYALLSESEASVVLYLNQATLNFQALAAVSPAHVHVSHGESEKISMVSNQLKAYDYVFTAGPAARQRIGSHLVSFDQSHCVDVGRPQLDEPRVAPSELPVSDRVTVMYAPTWEGDSPSMAYSSVADRGVSIVESLLKAGKRVIYRPHPQTGSKSRATRRAHRDIQQLLQAAGADHFVDRGPSVGWQWDVASEFVVDVSAMAYDAVASGKPTVIVVPASADAEVSTGGIVSKITTLDASHPDVNIQLQLAATPEALAAGEAVAEYHFGEVSPGAQIKRFIAATLQVIEERRNALAERRTEYGPAAE